MFIDRLWGNRRKSARIIHGVWRTRVFFVKRTAKRGDFETFIVLSELRRGQSTAKSNEVQRTSSLMANLRLLAVGRQR